MDRKRSVLVVVLLLVLSFSLTAGAKDDTIIIGSGAEAVSLDPRVENDAPSFERINMIMEPLLKYNENMELAPLLAKEWEVSEDTTTITFVLEEGVTWQDGVPFTAADVKYTFEWVLDVNNNAQNRGLFVDIEQIEIVDDYNIVFHLSQPNGFLINSIPRLAITPKHDGDRADFAQKPLGTGPYKFVSWSRDDRMVLEAYEDYWRGKPNIANVIFRPIPENATKLLAFEAGEIDIFQGGVVPQEIDRLEANPNFIVQRTPGTGYTYLGINFRVAALADVRVRQAINHLFDREGIVKHVLNGIGTPAIGPITAALPWFNEDLAGYDYNPERAKELLAEAGYGPGDIKLRVHTNENPERIRIAELLQFEAQQVGIELEVIVEEWGAYLSRIQETDDFDLWLLGWVGLVDADRALNRQFHTDGSNNYGKYSNERIDEIIETGRVIAPDTKESFDIYNEGQEIIVRDAVYAFINYSEEVSVQHKWIENWQIHPFANSSWQDIWQAVKNK